MSDEQPWFCQKCRVMMEPVNADFCRCPNCGSEVWYNYSQDKVTGPPVSGSYVSLSMQPGENIMGGGGSVGHAKKKGKKKSLAQINASLAYEYHKT